MWRLTHEVKQVVVFKRKLENILRNTIKVFLSQDCPETLVDYHVDAFKYNLKSMFNKVKSRKNGK